MKSLLITIIIKNVVILNQYNLEAIIYLYHSIKVNWPAIPSRYPQEAIIGLCTATHRQQASSNCFSSAFPNL